MVAKIEFLIGYDIEVEMKPGELLQQVIINTIYKLFSNGHVQD